MPWNPIAGFNKLLASLTLFLLLFCAAAPQKAQACGQGAYAPQTCQVSSFTNANGGPDTLDALYTTTGNPYHDQWLAAEINFAQTQFGVRPFFGMYDDGRSPNAYATDRVYHSAFPDGTVALGFTLFYREIQRTNSYCSVAAVIAHEYAHIVQFKYGTPLRGKYVELQADFLSGWYMARRSLFVATNPMGTLNALRSESASGSYGTGEERAQSFLAGWQSGALSLPQAWAMSVQYVANF